MGSFHMKNLEEVKAAGDLELSQNENIPQPEQQQQVKGTNFFMTCLNGLNALSGIGMLSAPYAVSQGGWLSLMLLFLVALLCCYTGILLKRCMDTSPLIKTYPDIAHFAFGDKGRAIVSLFMYLELYLLAVEFLILEGDNLDKLFPKMGVLHIFGLKLGGKKCFVLLSGLLVLPTTWLRSLGLLAYVSAGGVIACFVLVICVFCVGAVDHGVGFRSEREEELLHWRGIPTTVSLFAFCFCGHAVFPTLCNSMKEPRKFPMVLVVCFITSTLTYASMAVIGYLMYGQNVKPQVTLNLPLAKISTKVAIYTTVIIPLTKYAVIITPIAASIEELPLFKKSKLISILIRTILLISTVIAAITIPFFGYVMAFIGAFLSVTASFLLPCLCYLKIRKEARKFGLRLIMIIGIVVVGSFVAVVGTYVSLEQIVNHL